MTKDFYSKLLKVSKETGLPVKKALDIFYLLRLGETINNNDLLQKVGVSRNVINQLKQSLSGLFKPVSQSTQLNPHGLNQISSLFKEKYFPEEKLWAFLENGHFRKLMDLLQSIQNKRPRPQRQYDQFTATTETVARRACLLNFLGDIQEKQLLFLGDNDFTSVAAAYLGGAKKIIVVDIDERILSEIKTISKNYHLGMETKKYDAREKLPLELTGKFDVVFTDPPYTKEGIQLFVSRAIESLDKNNQTGRIYVCYGNSDRAKERFLPIYETMVNSGLMIRWIFDKFNRYEKAESIGSASSLFITEITPKTKPLIKENYDRPIYTKN